MGAFSSAFSSAFDTEGSEPSPTSNAIRTRRRRLSAALRRFFGFR